MSADKKSPGLALLLMGKSKDGAKGEHQDHEELSDEQLDEARKDAGDAILDAHDAKDGEALAEAHYTLHKLHAEKSRREEGD
jgi:hypothetical protein